MTAPTGGRRTYGRLRHGWRGAARRGLHAAAVTAVATGAMGCVAVLGLDEYESAVEQLCRCDQHLPQLAGECVSLLSDRLAHASEPTREAWLSHFAEHCAGSCDQAYDCFGRPPTCVSSGLECASDRECCGWSEGGVVACQSQQCRP